MSDIENAEENVTSSEHADKTMIGVYCTLNISIVSTYPAGHKRARCGECAGCTASSCKICKYCRDSPKFGGPGKLKKACIQRICTNMQPPMSSKIKQLSQPVKSSKMKFI